MEEDHGRVSEPQRMMVRSKNPNLLKINKNTIMKRKRIEIDESVLMTSEEQSQIRGGERVRLRTKNGDGSKSKNIFIF